MEEEGKKKRRVQSSVFNMNFTAFNKWLKLEEMILKPKVYRYVQVAPAEFTKRNIKEKGIPLMLMVTRIITSWTSDFRKNGSVLLHVCDLTWGPKEPNFDLNVESFHPNRLDDTGVVFLCRFQGHNLHQTFPAAYSSITDSSKSAADRLLVLSLTENLGCSESKQSHQNYESAVVDPIKSRHENKVFFEFKSFSFKRDPSERIIQGKVSGKPKILIKIIENPLARWM